MFDYLGLAALILQGLGLYAQGQTAVTMSEEDRQLQRDLDFERQKVQRELHYATLAAGREQDVLGLTERQRNLGFQRDVTQSDRDRRAIISARGMLTNMIGGIIREHGGPTGWSAPRLPQAPTAGSIAAEAGAIPGGPEQPAPSPEPQPAATSQVEGGGGVPGPIPHDIMLQDPGTLTLAPVEPMNMTPGKTVDIQAGGPISTVPTNVDLPWGGNVVGLTPEQIELLRQIRNVRGPINVSVSD